MRMRICGVGFRVAMGLLAGSAVWVGGVNAASGAAATRAAPFAPATGGRAPGGGAPWAPVIPSGVTGGGAPWAPVIPNPAVVKGGNGYPGRGFNGNWRRGGFHGGSQNSGNGFIGGDMSSGGYYPAYSYYPGPGDPGVYVAPGSGSMMSGFALGPGFYWSPSGTAMMSGYARNPVYYWSPNGSAMMSGYGF
jgi:hypothetical protein